MAFLINLKRQAINSNKLVGDLAMGASYQILAMSVVDTKYEKSTACKLTDSASEGTINIFLSRHIQITSDEVKNYNEGRVPPISLIYRGKDNARFIIDFE
ncbi:unnamed protein product [Macrosiphum euphorbiae]|uniref:Uncharacterized protein n=1 Tax=Macrosiphum euphorbiae TaxID=13131 RepID=A0AAV0Y6S5_9HEMI|nr:unnamed protein product [Macrosiphum euphorbiae]